MKSRAIIQYTPVALTVALVLWTILVSPYSKYGDNWAIYPALLVFPLVVLWHIGLLILSRPKMFLFIYGLLHVLILFYVWLLCMMKISKDSL